MAFIETTPPERAQRALQDMYVRQQAAWGYVPNYAKVFCYRPEVLARWGRLLAEIKRPLPKRRFELVTFVTAHELRHSACTLQHARALGEFFSEEQILAIAAGRVDGVLDAAEQAMLEFARQVARDAASVTGAQVASLKRHGYTDAEVFDIAAVAAGRAFFTKLLDGLGVLADSPFQACAEPFRRALTVGRPIDDAECVTISVVEPEETPWDSG